ncbi:unnamed protein product [Owenia fusiformis]|uniref:Uncharacterized protein n=1 Tax=Owenia fusiformis TaxID=6347 RepID=A0A8J1XNF2_OWEFU|nr:unnamed protein product [Owenia fusiformis]
MTQLGGTFAILVAVVSGVTAQCDCANTPGLVICEYACTYYIYCENNGENRVDCPVGQVLNFDTLVCDLPERIPPPCGSWRDCTGKADGYYANLDDSCLSYHFCQSGIFQGNNICPSGTVFNDRKQACDWPANTCPPCGNASCILESDGIDVYYTNKH